MNADDHDDPYGSTEAGTMANKSRKIQRGESSSERRRRRHRKRKKSQFGQSVTVSQSQQSEDSTDTSDGCEGMVIKVDKNALACSESLSARSSTNRTSSRRVMIKENVESIEEETVSKTESTSQPPGPSQSSFSSTRPPENIQADSKDALRDMEICVPTMPSHCSRDGDVVSEMMKMDLELNLGDNLVPVKSKHRKRRLWLCFMGCSISTVIVLVTLLILLAEEENGSFNSFDKNPPMTLEDFTYSCTPNYLSRIDGKLMCKRICHNAEECCSLSIDDPFAGCRNIRNETHELDLCEEYKEKCAVLDKNS